MKNSTEFTTATIQMSVKGVPTEMKLEIPKNAVKPQRMLPVFEKMTNNFVQISIDEIENNKEISCKAGCGACCKQLVPIAKIEAHRIAKLIRSLPALEKVKVVKRFEEGYEQLTKSGWFKQYEKVSDLSRKEKTKLGMDYFHEGIPCPFLEKGACSIHPVRPLVCREYLVTSPAENCSAPTAESIEMVDQPIKMSTSIYRLSEEISPDNEPGYFPLISTLEWTKENPDIFPTNSGENWLGIAMRKMMKTEEKNSETE